MDRMTAFSWWQSLPWLQWRIVGVVEAADDVPEHLPRNGAILVGDVAHPKWLAFDCPCRQDHRILLSLDSRIRPHWRVTDASRLSLTPSVDAHTGRRRCHYIIRSGKVTWVRERE